MTTLARATLARATPFAALERQAPDALLALIAMHRADPRAEKIDLGVGVYRDVDGRTPVMRAIKAAERRLAETQPTKAYLGAEGDLDFVRLLERAAFGDALADGGTLHGIQTPGGTGALRLAAELYRRARPHATVWIGAPTWPNHGPIFAAAGLAVRSHAFYDTRGGTLDFAGMIAALETAAPGDIALLHGCCHNPTGARFADDQWLTIADLCAARGIVPLIDLAYQGLGDGWEADVAGTRLLLDRVPAALVAYSCDKNFGLYRDRVGALWLHEADEAVAAIARQNMLVLARSLWSMPPDHGAAAVRIVLEDAELTADWRAELDAMRGRLNDVRAMVAAADPALARLGVQRGMFGLLPLTPAQVAALRADHGIYMAGSGRINLAGLTAANIDHFVSALSPYLQTWEPVHG